MNPPSSCIGAAPDLVAQALESGATKLVPFRDDLVVFDPASLAAFVASLASSPIPAAASVVGEQPSDEQILHRWDTHVGDPTPSRPLTDADKLEFGRAVLALRPEGGDALDWPAIEKVVDEFVDDYEMRGETEDGRDACYTPNEHDRALLRDCIAGLLAHGEFLAAIQSQGADHEN